MKGFFERQWELFLADMQEVGEFFLDAFGANEQLMLGAPKADKVEGAEGFFAREWRLFKEDMQSLGEMVMAPFETEDTLMLDAAPADMPKAEASGDGFFKREWELFKTDLDNANSALESLFGVEKKNEIVDCAEAPVEFKDEVDVKLETFLGEPINELKESACGDRTQHEVLRDYAEFFKPYAENPDMCQMAFKKYYDRHALKMAVSELPIEQVRIVQNNVDIFIKGQESFGEPFVDSRVDTVFEKAGIDEVNKVIGIIGDCDSEGKTLKGERLFAEAVNYMVDHGIRVAKDGGLIDPVKKAIEAQHDEIHNAMRSFEDVGPEYQELLAKERTYLDALNRIEQYETEKRIAAFEAKMSDEVSGLDVIL